MGDLVRVSHGVWRMAESVDELAGQCRALLSMLPSGSVVGGLTAARLHGLWLPAPRDDEPIEVILRGVEQVPRELSASRRTEIRGRRRQLGRAEMDVVDGIPVTAEARTWVDLAELVPMADLVAAGDSVLRGTTTRRELELFVRDARGRRGVVAARGALELLDERSRSRPESHLRFRLVDGGLPKPEVNRPIHDDHGQWVAEPDLHYERGRLALEYNGALHAEPDQMRKDITRGLDVVRADWMTRTFGPAQVFSRWDDTVALVRTLLDARDPAWRARRRAAG
ncbi:MAG TPA: hypothetical protein VFT67_11115 [Jatrophihabitantaceae bacterium]|nr:hypothetical protein [Jatrophihabitantaceae bacterium]